MKKLQSNFTTIEQSKRLLELGVPADSADLFYSKFESETFENRPTLCYDKKYSDIVPDGYKKYYLPCWSVGRLIEIYCLCVDEMYSVEFLGQIHTRPMDKILQMFEHVKLDFSKLYEDETTK